MNYNRKSFIIMAVVFIISLIVMNILPTFFKLIGLEKMNILCVFIPTTTMGIYIIFGKFVYFHGPLYSRKKKIFWGIIIILSMPLGYLLFS